MDFLQSLGWQALLIAAVITTFIVSAINTIQAKISTNWLVFIVSIIVTVLSTTFESNANFSDWQKIALQILFTMAFSILFYNYAGKWFVDELFLKIKGILTKKIGNLSDDTKTQP